jgi:hypothetical protein
LILPVAVLITIKHVRGVNVVIRVKGCNTTILKTAYCADRMKYCLVMEEGAERKYLNINRIKN